MNSRPSSLVVLHLPGLSARMLAIGAPAWPAVTAMLEGAHTATLAPLSEATPEQAETSLVTGLLPPYLNDESGKDPFWIRARERLGDAMPDFLWRELPPVDADGDPVAALAKLSRALKDAAGFDAVAMVSAWAWRRFGQTARAAGPNSDPADRPVLITRGLEQPRACIGVCEVAGLFEQALTGERIRDAR